MQQQQQNSQEDGHQQRLHYQQLHCYRIINNKLATKRPGPGCSEG